MCLEAIAILLCPWQQSSLKPYWSNCIPHIVHLLYIALVYNVLFVNGEQMKWKLCLSVPSVALFWQVPTLVMGKGLAFHVDYLHCICWSPLLYVIVLSK